MTSYSCPQGGAFHRQFSSPTSAEALLVTPFQNGFLPGCDLAWEFLRTRWTYPQYLYSFQLPQIPRHWVPSIEHWSTGQTKKLSRTVKVQNQSTICHQKRQSALTTQQQFLCPAPLYNRCLSIAKLIFIHIVRGSLIINSYLQFYYR